MTSSKRLRTRSVPLLPSTSRPSRRPFLSGSSRLELRSDRGRSGVAFDGMGHNSGTRPDSSRFDFDMRWVSKTTCPRRSLRRTSRALGRIRRRFRLPTRVRLRRIRAYVPPLPLPPNPPQALFWSAQEHETNPPSLFGRLADASSPTRGVRPGLQGCSQGVPQAGVVV